MVINAKVIDKKLLSKLEEMVSAQAFSVCALVTLSLNVMWSRNHCVVVMASSTSVVLVKGEGRLYLEDM